MLDIEVFNMTFVHDFEDLTLLEVKPGNVTKFLKSSHPNAISIYY